MVQFLFSLSLCFELMLPAPAVERDPLQAFG
jgi:hypothetical protein